MISVKYPDSSYPRNENNLFTNPEMNKLFSLSITPPVSDFDTLETKDMVKKIIDTIKFSKYLNLII
jgi:hypothetical protein